MKNYKKFTLKDFGVKREERILKNGCKVILYNKKNSPFYMNVLFLAGSRYDPIGKEGLAHFTEHMVMSKTKKFSSSDKIIYFLEKFGGSISPYTDSDQMVIEADIADNNNLNILLTVINEVVNNPVFENNKFKNEKNVIRKELAGRKNNPTFEFNNIFNNTLFRGTHMEKTTIGTDESISSIKLKDVVSFYKRHITPENCTIIASGDISMEELIIEINKRIKFKNSGKNIINRIPYKLPTRGEKIVVSNNSVKQAVIKISYRIYPNTSSFLIIRILNLVLTSSMASRLNIKLRVEKGLIYSIKVGRFTTNDIGSFSVNTTLSKEKVNDVINIILKEIEDIAKNGLKKEELDFAKNKTYNSVRKWYQTTEDWVDTNALSETLFEDKKTNIDLLNDLMVIENKEIKDFASKYLVREKAFIGICSADN